MVDLFIDFDDTIYDTHGNAQIALAELYDHFQLGNFFKSPDEFTIPYWQVNKELWDLYALGQIDRDFLMVERFRRPLSVGIDANGQHLDPSREYCLEISDYFLDRCSCKPGVVTDAHEVMRYLKNKGYRLFICSNGFHEVQYKKLRASNLLDYFDAIILSEDAGANKPAAQFFDYALKISGGERNNTVMIGDNLSTDIKGARDAGLTTVYFNRHATTIDDQQLVDHEITSLAQLKDIF